MGTGAEKRWLLSTAVVVVVLFAFFMGNKPQTPTMAMPQPQTANDGRIIVVPIQIERDNYGLAMVDTVAQTLWIYGLTTYGPAHSRLKLIAARNWRYDKLLQQYNTAEPKPEQVKMLLEDLGQFRQKPDRKKLRHPDKNLLEIAEPNDRNIDN